MKGAMMGDSLCILAKAATLTVRLAFLLLAVLFVLLGLTFLPVIGVLLAPPLLCLANCISFESPEVAVCQRSRTPFWGSDKARQIHPLLGRVG
jgi:hypothetical protein